MSNELVSTSELSVAKYADEKVFASISTSANFLPYLQLCGGNNKFAKKALVPIGQYALIRGKDNIEVLGKEVTCLPLSWRPKAMDTSGDEVISVFDPSDPEFKRIMEESEQSDSNCFFGPEFLLYLPEANPPCFTTFMMGSKTARSRAPELKALIGKGSTLKVTFIETKKFSWHGPIVTPCSDPFPVPSVDERTPVVNRFNNPPEKETEKAETETAQEGVAR